MIAPSLRALAAAALFAVAVAGCFGDSDLSRAHHPCAQCPKCSVCTAVINGVAVCEPKQHHVKEQCDASGVVVSFDGCGLAEAAVASCSNTARCENTSDTEAACVCRNHWQGAGCATCPSNWNAALDCAECAYPWSGENCEECAAHWDLKSGCTVCEPHFAGSTCEACAGHWDEATQCTSCKDGFEDQGNDCASCMSGCAVRGETQCSRGQSRRCEATSTACLDWSAWKTCGEIHCNECAGNPQTSADCHGVLGGTATFDHCKVCDDDPGNDDSSCARDCNGVWGGSATTDACGMCDDDPSNDCVKDCAGTAGGHAVVDMCGTCDADPSNDCQPDCSGVYGGPATRDMCGVCDSNPNNDCVQDCAGVYGGAAFVDNCGTCDSDASNDCQPDCNGVYGGHATRDFCGTCDAEPGNDCPYDCRDKNGNFANEDHCGVCDMSPANDDQTCRSCSGMRSCSGADALLHSCCKSETVTGGTFYMGRTAQNGNDTCPSSYACDGSELPAHNATVADFQLDAYEVTVGRFRQFVAAYGAGFRPNAGDGANPSIANSGWSSDWDGSLPGTSATLAASLACSSNATWTDSVQDHEQYAINCVDWYEAFAFCIWDRGRLPTEAEWEYAAAGGNDDRLFPWGGTLPGAAVASYANAASSPLDATGARPNGKSRYGQFDMAGHLREFVLDWYDAGWYGAGPGNPCTNCAALDQGSRAYRVVRGGSYLSSETSLRAAARDKESPGTRTDDVGFRCAR